MGPVPGPNTDTDQGDEAVEVQRYVTQFQLTVESLQFQTVLC